MLNSEHNHYHVRSIILIQNSVSLSDVIVLETVTSDYKVKPLREKIVDDNKSIIITNSETSLH